MAKEKISKPVYEAESSEVYTSTDEMKMHEKTESIAEMSYERWMGGSPANTLDAYKKWSTGK